MDNELKEKKVKPAIKLIFDWVITDISCGIAAILIDGLLNGSKAKYPTFLKVGYKVIGMLGASMIGRHVAESVHDTIDTCVDEADQLISESKEIVKYKMNSDK